MLALPALLAATLTAATANPASAPAEEPFLARYAATRGFRAGLPTGAVLTPDGSAAVFLRSPPRSPVQALFQTDLASGATRELATAERLLAGAAASLTPAEQAQLERLRITARGITRFQLSRDGARVLVTVGGRLFLLDRAGGGVTAVKTGGRAMEPRLSPDGKRLAYVVGHDLWVQDLATGVERALTTGGTEDFFSGSAEFVAAEELDRAEGFWWSPDSARLAYQETDQREVERFTIHDPLHPERDADAFRYPRAGQKNALVRVGVISAEGGPTTWLDWDRARLPYLAAVTWSEHAPLSLVVYDRAQQEQVLLAADAATGVTRALVTERDAAWVDHTAGYPRWSKDGKTFLWRTERRGGPELELRAAGGAPLATLVAKEAGFGRLVGWDEAAGKVWFSGGPNPTQTRLWSARKGEAPAEWRWPGAPVDEPASVAATISRNGAVLLAWHVTFAATTPPVAFTAAGKRLVELPSVAEPLPFPTRGEIRKVGPGEGLWTSIVRPRDFVAGRKLPVLVSVYGGPHANMVRVGSNVMSQWLADQGFLVVSIDGRGTPGRGRDFERAIRGDFAGPALADQVAGLTALAAEVPELDLGRVGIQGWSFGGYMAALAVLARPDVFKVAVAGAPVVDWRDYDTAYTERYLGLLPQDQAAYDRSSLLPLAPGLKRPLLLVHGTADDNVYFFHSLKLADALLRAGKNHDFLVLPGLTHLALNQAEPAVAEKIWARMIGFLKAGLEAPAP